MTLREIEGREASPTAVIIDTQSGRTTEKGALAATMPPRRSRAASAISGSIPPASCSVSLSMPPSLQILWGVLRPGRLDSRHRSLTQRSGDLVMEKQTAVAPTAAAGEVVRIFLALELSRSSWLVASHTPAADKISRHKLAAGDIDGL